MLNSTAEALFALAKLLSEAQTLLANAQTLVGVAPAVTEHHVHRAVIAVLVFPTPFGAANTVM